MNAARKIMTHLRSEPEERLPKLQQLYRHDATASKLIAEEIKRRQAASKTN